MVSKAKGVTGPRFVDLFNHHKWQEMFFLTRSRSPDNIYLGLANHHLKYNNPWSRPKSDLRDWTEYNNYIYCTILCAYMGIKVYDRSHCGERHTWRDQTAFSKTWTASHRGNQRKESLSKPTFFSRLRQWRFRLLPSFVSVRSVCKPRFFFLCVNLLFLVKPN